MPRSWRSSDAGRVSVAPRGCIAMRPHAAETVLLASSLVAFSTGCSFAMHGTGGSFDLAPGVEQHASSDCSGSDAVPIVDTVIGSVLVAGGTAVIVSGSQGNKTNDGWI